MTVEILNVVAPVLVIVGLGYLVERRGFGLDSASLGRLVMTLGTPSLVFSALMRASLTGDDIAILMGCALTAILVAGLLTAATLALLRLPLTPFLPVLSLPNAGNVGLPVLLFAFGEEGLAIGIALFFTVALVQYLAVPVVMAGRFRPRALLAQPLVWALAAVAAFRLGGVAPPTVAMETTRILGGMMVPVMLLLLGGALARLRVGDVALSVGLALLRLVVGVAAGAATVWLFGLTGVMAASVFLIASMPTALVTYVFAQRYDKSPDRVAGVVVSSTVVTFAALPLLLAVALRIAGTV